MVGAVVSFLATMFSVGAASYLLPGVHADNIASIFWAALVMGVINAFVKPILLILTLPINFLTLGLFTLVINGLLILLVSSVVPGFEVDGLLWAIVFSIVVSLVNSFVGTLTK